MNKRTDWRRQAAQYLLLALALSIGAGGKAASGWKVETVSEPVPDPVAASLRETLSEQAVRVSGPEGPVLDIWWRKALPVKTGAAPKLGLAYPQIAEGEFLGVMKLHAVRGDFRDQQIQPGVYTFRHALHPVDGAHQGVALYRDFLLLVKAEEDKDPAAMETADLLRRSGAASGTGHVSMWSLLEPEDSPASYPALVQWEEEGWGILYVKLATSAGELELALIVSGHAPEA